MRSALVIASMVMVLAPAVALAKGAPTVYRAHLIAAVPPLVTQLHNVQLPSADKVLQGCGGHRYRDPNTNECRGF